ncbi:MAG: hypothetical protein RL721_155, partial [Candidatus Eisenbacteria bacterium]
PGPFAPPAVVGRPAPDPAQDAP